MTYYLPKIFTVGTMFIFLFPDEELHLGVLKWLPLQSHITSSRAKNGPPRASRTPSPIVERCATLLLMSVSPPCFADVSGVNIIISLSLYLYGTYIAVTLSTQQSNPEQVYELRESLFAVSHIYSIMLRLKVYPISLHLCTLMMITIYIQWLIKTPRENGWSWTYPYFQI